MSEQNMVWEAIYARDGDVFPDPHEDMPRLAETLQQRGARDLLDLGCGTGRHLAYFARCGFFVAGIDGAPAGLALAKRKLRAAGLAAELCCGDIYDPLPYVDATFDAVVSVQVVHHATLQRIAALTQEITRVLRAGGLVYLTVPQQRNQGTRFQQIEPSTYIPLDGREAGLPHHYFTPEELRALFPALVVVDVHLDNGQHYCLTAIKPA
jgi:SAM-dependent methyltransferase